MLNRYVSYKILIRAGALLLLLAVFGIAMNAQARKSADLIAQGKQIFRFDTFGDEAFWGGALQLHRAIAGEKLGGVLDEAVGGDEVLEGLHGDEVVVDAVGLALAGGAGGVGDGEREDVRVALEEEVVEGPLADARGAGEDYGAGVLRES